MRTTLESLGASPNSSYRYLFEWPTQALGLLTFMIRPGSAFYFTTDYSTVSMHIDGWREAEGLQIPTRLCVMGGPVHSPIRTITITDAQLTEARPEPPKDTDRIQ
jgi:hypothetical protein